jgi:hypothetical protein
LLINGESKGFHVMHCIYINQALSLKFVGHRNKNNEKKMTLPKQYDTEIVADNTSSTGKTCISCGYDGCFWPQICAQGKCYILPKKMNMHQGGLHGKC